MTISQSEQNDCTVRATARAYEITYEAAHQLMTISGRQLREGHSDFRYWAQNQPITEFLTFSEPLPLRHFLTQHPVGTWLVVMVGHAFCVRNGEVLNDYPLSPNTKILWAARTDGTTPRPVGDPKRNEVSQDLLAEFRTVRP